MRTANWQAALVVLALWTGASSAQPEPLSDAADKVIAVAQNAHLAGEIALTDQTGAIVDRVMGFADREAKKPHKLGERWVWASVTKQLTAILAIQEAEIGKLSLDETVHTYLPDFKGPSGSQITIRDLLQHTSGLPNPDNSPANSVGVPTFYTETGTRTDDNQHALGYCAGPPKSAHAGQFSYNNCDYLVLGAILERLTGKSYAALFADRIASKLDLLSVRMAPDGAERGGADTIGYIDGGKRAPALNVATFGAAGALTGTASDLLAIDRALVAGTLLKPESRAVLWQGNPKLGYEALGAWSFPAHLAGCAHPVALIERRGDVGGIQVRNVIAPALGRSIAILINDDTIDFGEVWQGKGLSFDLLSAAFCQTPPIRTHSSLGLHRYLSD